MDHEDDSWRIRVLAGGDTLRTERWTRELFRELDTIDGLRVGLVDGEGGLPDPHRKGAGIAELALCGAVVVPISAATAQVAVTAIKEWCARDRHHKIEISRGDLSVTVAGPITEDYERLIQQIIQAPDVGSPNNNSVDES